MAQRAMADALARMANAMETASRNAERADRGARRGNEDELRLERFLKNGPTTFSGGFDPDGAQKCWRTWKGSSKLWDVPKFNKLFWVPTC
jgi:hypothetical protein